MLEKALTKAVRSSKTFNTKAVADGLELPLSVTPFPSTFQGGTLRGRRDNSDSNYSNNNSGDGKRGASSGCNSGVPEHCPQQPATRHRAALAAPGGAVPAPAYSQASEVPVNGWLAIHMASR